jgi:tetratricopeptide (TPR) repeat protein
LKHKLEDFKEKKVRKKFRKQHYDNWTKTESILRTKQFSNYQKWELYESSEDESTPEPILPKNDPNFLALEKDLQESVRQREISRNKSLKLKDEGNLMIKEGRFTKAIECYTDAINETRGMMVLYTNRALAYIRVEDWEKAIVDCDRVIEYYEVFEEELPNNKELYAKALSRKAMCLQKLKNYVEAIECLDKAAQHVSDTEIEKLKAVIQLEEETHNKACAILKGDSEEFKIIDGYIVSLQRLIKDEGEVDTKEHESVMRVLNKEDNKIFFIHKGGLEIVFTLFRKHQQLVDLIALFNTEERFIIEINNIKGYNKLVHFLFDGEKNELNERTLKGLKTITDILEDASQNEFVRKNLCSIKKIDELFKLTFGKFDITDKSVTSNHDKVIILLHLFTLISNLCYNSDDMRAKIVQSYEIEPVLEKYTQTWDFENLLHRNLCESLLSLLTNLSCDNEFRENAITSRSKLAYIGKQFIGFTIQVLEKICKMGDIKSNEDLYEKILGLLFNLSHVTIDVTELYVEFGLGNVLSTYLVKLYDEKHKSLVSNLLTI